MLDCRQAAAAGMCMQAAPAWASRHVHEDCARLGKQACACRLRPSGLAGGHLRQAGCAIVSAAQDAGARQKSSSMWIRAPACGL